MPVLKCPRTLLLTKIGLPNYTDNEFIKLCFNFGIELDEVTSEREIYLNEVGGEEKADKDRLSALKDELLYKIDLPANRYDLLSLEGLSTALNVFLGNESPPKYAPLPPKHTMTVHPSVIPVRPYVMCAILRGISFDDESYKSFIDLQERLHLTLARKRSLCSIGTHDLSKVSAEFSYEATPKGEIDFLPLAHHDRGNLKGSAIEEYYKNDKHIGQYVPLISGGDNFPVVYDSKRTVMSLPPIINSDFSKISQDTKDIFVEVTAVDYMKATLVLNMVVAGFSGLCKDIESVKVKYPEKLEWLESEEIVTPMMGARDFTVGVDYINKSVGINVSVDEICTLLKKMLLEATPSADKESILVKVPCTRADILHPCDIMEDVAIAYGYGKILDHCEQPNTLSFGRQQPREAMRHMMRNELGLAGFTEMMTFSLCSEDESMKFCKRDSKFYNPKGGDAGGVVHIGNPKAKEFQVCRPSLLPGTLKTLSHSKNQPLPMQLFEVTDVVLKDPTHRIGARYAICLRKTPSTNKGCT